MGMKVLLLLLLPLLPTLPRRLLPTPPRRLLPTLLLPLPPSPLPRLVPALFLRLLLPPFPPPLPTPLLTPLLPLTMFQIAVRRFICSLLRFWPSWRLTRLDSRFQRPRGCGRDDKNLRLFVLWGRERDRRVP